MKTFGEIMFALICCWYTATRDVGDRAIMLAETYLGHEEVTHNSSPHIDYWLERLGLPPGNNYCAAFAAMILDSVQVDYPTVRSAAAQHYITPNSIRASNVMQGYPVEKGAIAIWKRGDTWMGHVGFVISWQGSTGVTIEANTTPSGPSEGRGNGVYRKERKIIPTAYFRITHFTNLK